MGSGVLGYTLRRVLWAVPVLFVISVMVFYMLRLAPNDPVDAILGRNAYQEDVANRLREKYGYDDPIYVQYWKYMKNLAQGDLGLSTQHQDFTAGEVIWPKIWTSTQLNMFALVIVFGLGIPVGVYAALARGTFLDPLAIGGWLLLDAIPTFVMAPILIWLFATQLGVVGLTWEGPYSTNAILPILIISLPGVAGVARLMRASVISVIGEDYVRTARAKGLKESTVIITHITRNALLPMVTVIGLSLPGLTSGSLFVELFFGIPGIGRESLAAATTPDYDVILAIVLFGSVLFVGANILVDVLYGFIDPRVRIGAGRGG
ncbi:MAG: ABC transporter permease [Dehalococcoidia bacterium]|nr:ABC transporter permease [Dehalococcoidia bacterium]MCB9484783.1 ABC transporter permease [Thermoflexaceae bacterium]